MTTSSLSATLTPPVADLSRDLPEDERYCHLLRVLRDLLPCGATVLLCLDGEYLIPLVVNGLSPDTLGWRFRVDEHPRLKALLERRGPTRFPTDYSLPGPYGGLVEGLHGHLEIHNCLDYPLYLDDQLQGLLTLNILDPSRFASADLDTLETFASLAAATVKTSERMRDLTRHAEGGHQRVEAHLEAAGERPWEMIDQSATYKALLEKICLVASNDLSVLITGETGVGRGLVAQSIHQYSARSGKPMISLNCAVLPETLVESKLFGHVHSALSGTVNERCGKLELADDDSLFLDEVGELSLTVQTKLLRVPQSGQLQRVGSDRGRRVDMCLVAATDRDLIEEVRTGRFRADLYYHLSVYPLCVPPLRERGRDILLMAGYSFEENRPRLGLRSLRLDHEAQVTFLDYHWPGNVRELEHLVGRASLKAFDHSPGRSRVVTLHRQDLDLPAETPAPPRGMVEPTPATPTTGHSLRTTTDAYQRHLVQGCLTRHQGDWTSAAYELGLDRANLTRLMHHLRLR